MRHSFTGSSRCRKAIQSSTRLLQRRLRAIQGSLRQVSGLPRARVHPRKSGSLCLKTEQLQPTHSTRARSAIETSSCSVWPQRLPPVVTVPTTTSAPRKLPRSRRSRMPPLPRAASSPLSELRIPHAYVGLPLSASTPMPSTRRGPMETTACRR